MPKVNSKNQRGGNTLCQFEIKPGFNSPFAKFLSLASGLNVDGTARSGAIEQSVRDEVIRALVAEIGEGKALVAGTKLQPVGEGAGAAAPAPGAGAAAAAAAVTYFPTGEAYPASFGTALEAFFDRTTGTLRDDAPRTAEALNALLDRLSSSKLSVSGANESEAPGFGGGAKMIGGRRKAPKKSSKKASSKKSSKKASAKKSSKKTSAKMVGGAKKKSSKKASAKKSSKKASAKKSSKKTSAKKSSKKTSVKMVGGAKKKAGSKKAGSKKAGSKKAGSKKAGSKKGSAKMMGGAKRKAGSKKAGSKKAGSKKAGSKRRANKN
jgi:hypothetical protein